MRYDKAIYRTLINKMVEDIESLRLSVYTSSMYLSENDEDQSVLYFDDVVSKLSSFKRRVDEFLEEDSFIKSKKK